MKISYRKIFLVIGTSLNIFIAIMFIASAYSGVINPDTFASAGLLNMSFPAWILLLLLMIILNVIFKRKLLFIPLLSIILCIGPLLNFSPVNIFKEEMTKIEKQNSFTVMTYNMMNYVDAQNIYPKDYNRTLSYILSVDADIVCLQECAYMAPFPKTGQSKAQIDSVKRQYPYISISATGQSILSKYPFTPIDLGVSKADKRDMAAYLVEIGDEIVTIYNLHLYSFGLDKDDKTLYRNLTNLKADDNIKRAKKQLVTKVNEAARQRARQARLLRAHIDKTGGNIIVCGDFNDVPNCYAVRTIKSDRMIDAYRENAFGPTITYNANRLYFRIDHVLYQGKLKAMDIQRGNTKSSDHYPLLTTFTWSEE